MRGVLRLMDAFEPNRPLRAGTLVTVTADEGAAARIVGWRVGATRALRFDISARRRSLIFDGLAITRRHRDPAAGLLDVTTVLVIAIAAGAGFALGGNRSTGAGADDRTCRRTAAAAERAADDTAEHTADDGAADHILRRCLLNRPAHREGQKRRKRKFRNHVHFSLLTGPFIAKIR